MNQFVKKLRMNLNGADMHLVKILTNIPPQIHATNMKVGEFAKGMDGSLYVRTGLGWVDLRNPAQTWSNGIRLDDNVQILSPGTKIELVVGK